MTNNVTLWLEGSRSTQVPSHEAPGPIWGRKEPDASLPHKIRKWEFLPHAKKVAGQKPWEGDGWVGEWLGALQPLQKKPVEHYVSIIILKSGGDKVGKVSQFGK